MKKILAIIFTIAIVASMAVLPVSAEEWTQVIQEELIEDFEIYATNENAYTDEDTAGAPDPAVKGVHGGRHVNGAFPMDDELDVGVRVVDVNGDKMIQLSRHKEHHQNVSYQIETVGGIGGDIAASFSFMFKKLGEYGVAVRLGTDSNSLYDSWSFTNGIANIAGNADGEAWFTVWDEAQAADGNGRKMTNVLKLEANKEYKVVFLLAPFSNVYKVVINGEIMGEYTYFESPMTVVGLRLDQHGYDMASTAPENLKDLQDMVVQHLGLKELVSILKY